MSDLSHPSADQPIALVSLTFDDGLRCQFERGVPILNRHGFRVTFFLTANQEQTHEPWWGHINEWYKIDWREADIAMLKRLVQDGHEIGSHSVTHRHDKMPTQPDVEASESKRSIEGWLETNISSFCYPYYSSHAYLARAVMNAGYERARGGGPPPGYAPRNSYYTLPHDAALDRFNVGCRQISKEENVSEWIRPGCWHVLTFHAIGDKQDGWEPITVADFARQMAELAKLRDSGAVEIVTFKDGASRFRQLPSH